MTPVLFLRAFAAAAAAALCACQAAYAGRPMVTDDATIADPGNCQLEAWTQRPQDQTEYWAMPACRVGGWELGVGAGRIGPDGAGAYRSHMLQAKTILRPLEKNGWGLGLTIADQYRQGHGLSGDLAVLAPLSLSLLDDRVLVHLNAGWSRPQATRRGGALWAVGTEWAAAGPLTLTLEAYGAQRAHSHAQAGLHLDVIPDRLALDAGVGRRLGRGGPERYATLGLTVAAPVLR
ncbi:hypothetical protein [uncultured Massilia sp.]|uniref:hypothetical protein n=1 Tax=uncultured Massilia sp. TaxID=169973 RepID=UPI0025FABDAD|nr:hypothetical protein [uncultured Massilia sp.]